ncbi:MAG TPA: cation transporter [Azospirillum sp.]|nr:cation transporter [Azospirillum sp.]
MDAKERRVVVSMATVTAAILLSGAASLGSNVLVVRLDAVGSLIELVALAITYVALRRAKAAPSDDFNYGLGKLENLCGLLFAQVQIVYLAVFVWLAVGRLGAPAAPEGAGWGVLLYVYGAVVTGLMMRWSGALNRESPSPVAQSLWRGYQIKFWANITTGAVLALAALFPDQPLTQYLDPLNVLALCALRLRNIHRMLKESGRDLLDAAVDEHVRLIILRELAHRFDAYDDLLGYETRRSPGATFVTIHLGFTPDRPLTDVFEAVETLTKAIEAHVAGARVSIVPHKATLPAVAEVEPRRETA